MILGTICVFVVEVENALSLLVGGLPEVEHLPSDARVDNSKLLELGRPALVWLERMSWKRRRNSLNPMISVSFLGLANEYISFQLKWCFMNDWKIGAGSFRFSSKRLRELAGVTGP